MLASVSAAADAPFAITAAAAGADGAGEDGGNRSATAAAVTTAVRIGRSVVVSVGRSGAGAATGGGGLLETGVGRGGLVSSALATRAATVSLSRSAGSGPVS